MYNSKPTGFVLQISHQLRLGWREFLKAIREVRNEFDQGTYDAGSSLGGIHGKRALQALTQKNQIAELYNPNLGKKNKFNVRLKILQAFRRILLFFKRLGF
jgi:hypothetical protein